MNARLLMGLACIVLSGCATVSFDGAVKRGALAGETELKSIEILRQGKSISVRQHLPLEAGDRLRTDSESTAIISYATGTVVYVQPNSVVRIGSIFVEIGEIFVRAKGFFQVDTEFVTAGVEGTEYVVRVGPQQRVGVIVLSGRVACTSKASHWPRFTLGPYEKAKFERDGPPEPSRADEAEIDEIRRWVAEVEQARKPEAGGGGCCARGKAFTADRLRCALSRGAYYETLEEAQRVCAVAPAASAWCCAGGQVTQSTGENCARREGRFYDDLDQAKRNCQPPQTSGWCCTSIVLGRERQFNLSESTEQSCAAARGQYYRSLEDARSRCQPPAEPMGYCCVEYKISELTRKQCNERSGSFSNDRAALEKQCRKPFDPRIREKIYTPVPKPVIK